MKKLIHLLSFLGGAVILIALLGSVQISRAQTGCACSPPLHSIEPLGGGCKVDVGYCILTSGSFDPPPAQPLFVSISICSVTPVPGTGCTLSNDQLIKQGTAALLADYDVMCAHLPNGGVYGPNNVQVTLLSCWHQVCECSVPIGTPCPDGCLQVLVPCDGETAACITSCAAFCDVPHHLIVYNNCTSWMSSTPACADLSPTEPWQLNSLDLQCYNIQPCQ